MTAFRIASALILVCTSIGCTAKDAADSGEPASVSAQRLSRSIAVVDRYFARRTLGAPVDAQPDSNSLGCARLETPSFSLWVADYELLSASRSNSAVVVSVEVWSVARERESDQDALTFVVHPEERRDTLTWRVEGSEVCGYSVEGPDVGEFGRVDNVTFLNGSSLVALKAAADSVRERRRGRSK
jgi:hypothetical protein